MRTVIHEASFTDRKAWAWPDGDVKLLQVFDQVDNLNNVMQHVPKGRRRLAVQAGGACGIWPLRLSQLFAQVHTFEPNPDNYRCLVENVRGADGAISHRLAGLASARYSIAVKEGEPCNAGAGYIVPDERSQVYAVTIDSLGLHACDLIQLDVEGAELDALRGGEFTIRKYRPVVCLESKQLPHMRVDAGAAIQFLESLGYVRVGGVERDVILAHPVRLRE